VARGLVDRGLVARGLEGSRARGLEALSLRPFEPSTLRVIELALRDLEENGLQTRHPRFERIEIAAPVPIAATTTINSGAYQRRADIRRSS
jgi:hypothetical protein